MEKTIKFSELLLSEDVLKGIAAMGFENATPIQAQAIPHMLEGVDLIGQAQTGTGKTAAFGLPIIDTINPLGRDVQALILCPTRELCIQIAKEIERMAKLKKGISVLAIYGGDSYSRQINGLKNGANIVVGTPGRVMDHMRRGTLKLQNIKIAVLDEADEMLNMGFREDIESILVDTPAKKQTVMFSATMSAQILDISRKFLNNPKIIKVTGNNITAPNIEQIYFETRGVKKGIIISNLIRINDFKLSLVFCNTKSKADQLTDELRKMGLTAEALHGDLSQSMRNQVLTRFRQTQINVLVATDVAARGLDINNVDAVFNYDLPHDNEYYVHRIGRTGRAGKSGKAFCFAESRKDDVKIRTLQKFIKTDIVRSAVPDEKQIVLSSIDRLESQLVNIATENNLKEYENILQQWYGKGFDPHLLAACLMKINLDQNNVDLKKLLKADTVKPIKASNGSNGNSYNGNGNGNSEHYSDNPKVRMHLALGRKDKLKPGDIVGALTGECKISGNEIGVIDMFDHFSYFELSEAHVRTVMKGMKRNTIKGKKVILSIARN